MLSLIMLSLCDLPDEFQNDFFNKKVELIEDSDTVIIQVMLSI